MRRASRSRRCASPCFSIGVRQYLAKALLLPRKPGKRKSNWLHNSPRWRFQAACRSAKAMPRLDLAYRLCPLVTGVFDGLRLVEDQQVILVTRQLMYIPPKQKDVSATTSWSESPKPPLAFCAMQRKDRKIWRKRAASFFQLKWLIVWQYDQCRSIQTPALLFQEKVGKRLCRFCPSPCHQQEYPTGSVREATAARQALPSGKNAVQFKLGRRFDRLDSLRGRKSVGQAMARHSAHGIASDLYRQVLPVAAR